MTEPSSMSAPLNRGNAAAQIINDLRDQILRGKYPRGSKLPSERELASWYQVSVPTVREAIRGLSAVCLVEPRHGTGVYVTAAADVMFAMAASTLIEMEKIELLEVLDILGALLSKAAVLGCANATDEEIDGLAAALDRLDNAEASDERADNLRMFLRLLASASHNALIATICAFLSDLLVEIVRDESHGFGDDWQSVAQQLGPDRHIIVDAIRARDATRALAATDDYHVHTKRLVTDGLKASADDASALMRRAVKRVSVR